MKVIFRYLDLREGNALVFFLYLVHIFAGLCFRREASYDEEIDDGEEDPAAATVSEAHIIGRGAPRQAAVVRRPQLTALRAWCKQ